MHWRSMVSLVAFLGLVAVAIWRAVAMGLEPQTQEPRPWVLLLALAAIALAGIKYLVSVDDTDDTDDESENE